MNGVLENQNIGGGGFGFGGGGTFAGFLLGALLGNGGFGNNRTDHGDCRESIFAATTLSKLGNIEGAIPLSTAGINNTILEQTIANGTGFANVKDSVQANATAILLNANNNNSAVISAITALGDKIDANTIADLQRQLGVAQSALLEERGASRAREVEVTVSQNVSQAQAQAQLQTQIGTLTSALGSLFGEIQAVKQGQVIFNSGTMAASGTQAAANTKVA